MEKSPVPHPFTTPLILLIALLVLNHLVEQLIGLLGRREVRRWAAAPPPELVGVVDEEAYRKSIPYSLAKSRYALWTGLFDMLLLAAALALGILPALYAMLERALPAGHPALLGACYFTALILLTRVLSLPFSWYGTFRLEARFGFNKSTPGLWIGDQIKGLLLGLLLVFGLSFGLLALVGALPGTWWLWGFLAFTLFQALMLVLYPRLIMPLFNKFTPLPEGELRTRLFALAKRAGFGVSGIFVMDGSKRSAHANAFFTGFGRLRRIVLFDTLVNAHPAEELEAILAHEIGHFRLRHVLWGLVRSVVFSLVAFYVLFQLSQLGAFTASFGFTTGPGNLAPALLLALLWASALGFWFSPLAAWWSRRNEYAADRYARELIGGGAPLASALRRLSEKNLSNLTPHALAVAFHYSHPPLRERLAALER